MERPLVRLLLPLVALLAVGSLLLLRLLSVSTPARPATAPAALSGDIVLPANTMPAPELGLIDQNSKPVSVSALRGHVFAVTFLDSHCQQLCPIEADQLTQVQQSLGRQTAMALVVVSVAPATDTADSARSFAASHGWAGNWHWLLGTQSALALVWRAYSIDVKVTTADILHTTVLYLVDRNGYVRAGFVNALKPEVVTRDVRILAGHGTG